MNTKNISGKSLKKIILAWASFFLLLLAIFPHWVGAEDVTIADVSDPRPRIYSRGYEILTTDLNEIIPFLSSGWNLDAMIAGGDIDYVGPGTVGGTSSTFMRAFNDSTLFGTPLFFVMGNHEADNIYDPPVLESSYASYSNWNLKPGPSACPGTTYSFDKGDLHVAVLNVYCDAGGNTVTAGDVPNLIFDWLKNDLKSSDKKYKVVIGHEPAYPNGRHEGDSLDAHPENRDRFWNLLVTEKVSAYLAGHVHISKMADYDGVFEMNTGTSGSSRNSGVGSDPFTTLNYVHVDDGGITLKQVKENRNESSYYPDKWPDATTYTKTQADVSKEVLINTFERAGKNNKYWVDYDSSVEGNPNWSSNNNGKWWEQSFNDSAANWSSGETGLGFDRTNPTAWGWINTSVNSDPNSSGSNHVKSIYQRIPFSVFDKNLFSTLKLGLDYSGGVTAWLNGTKVFESPTSPSFDGDNYSNNFDKEASGTRNPWGKESRSPSFQDVDISGYKDLLNNGGNNLLVVANWGKTSDSSTISGVKLTLQPPSGAYQYWVSYNDCADYGKTNLSSTGRVSNTGGNEKVGDLVDNYNGATTGVQFAYTSSGTSEKAGAEDDGGSGRAPPVYPRSSTDAYNEFGTKINFGGVSYNNVGVSMVLTFDHLSSEKKYELTALGMRGRYGDRWCRYTLSDAADFENVSSLGTEVSTLNNPNDSTVFNCGDNYQDGYVAKWKNITPGSSTLKLTIRGVAHGSYSANEAILSVFKLSEAKPGNPTISSTSSEHYALGAASMVVPASSITIEDDSTTPIIKAENDIRIRIPDSLNMKWDSSITSVVLGGSGQDKASSSVTYEQDDKVVVIQINSDFSAGENISVSGLSYADLSDIANESNLELILDGADGYPLAFDDKGISIGRPSISSEESKVYAVGASSKVASSITVSEDDLNQTITSTNDIRIHIPDSLNLKWDPSHSSLTFLGSANTKVNTAVSFEDSNKTVVLDVTSDFSPKDTLIINGLYLYQAGEPGATDYLTLEVDNNGNITNVDDQSITVAPVPIVSILENVDQPSEVSAGSSNLVLGIASIVSSANGTSVNALTIKETGTINSQTDLSNTEIWLSDDANWDAGDSQLDAGKDFSGLDGQLTFSEPFTIGTTTKYLIIRSSVLSEAKSGRTIHFTFLEAQVDDDCTTSNFPLSFTTASRVNPVPVGWSTDSDWSEGTPDETIFIHSDTVGVGYWDDFNTSLSNNKWSNDSSKWTKEGVSTGTVEVSNSSGGSGTGYLHVVSPNSSSVPTPSDYDTTHGVFNLPPGKTLNPRYTLWYNGVLVIENSDAATSFSRGRFGTYMYKDATHFFSVIGSTHYGAFRISRTNGSYSNTYFTGSATTNVGVASTAPGNPVNAKIVVGSTTASSHNHTVYASVGSPENATLSHTDTTSLAGAYTFAVSACYHLNQNPYQSLIDSIWLRGGFSNGNYTTAWKDTGENISNWGNITVSTSISGDQSISMIVRSSDNESDVSHQTDTINLTNGEHDYDISSLGEGRYISIAFVLNTGNTNDTPTINSISWTKSIINPTEVPGNPINLQAVEQSNKDVELTWERNDNSENVFYLEKEINSGNGFGAWEKIAVLEGTTTTYTDDDGAQDNKGYKYRIRSANLIGYSGYTESATLFSKPSAPTSLSIQSFGSDSVKWTWQDNSLFEEGFRLRYIKGGAGDNFEVASNTSLYEAITLEGNTAYQIGLKSFVGSQESAEIYSDTVYTLSPDPSGFEATGDVNKTDLSVDPFTNDSSGQSGYYFINKTKNTNSGWVNNNYWHENSLENNTTYEYQVKLRNFIGTESGTICYSSGDCSAKNGAQIRVTTLSPTPQNFRAQPSLNSISLSVDSFNNDSSGLSGYYFVNTTNDSNSGWIRENNWEETNLTCGTSYSYEVKYRNQEGVETTAVSLSEQTSACEEAPDNGNHNDNSDNNQNNNDGNNGNNGNGNNNQNHENGHNNDNGENGNNNESGDSEVILFKNVDNNSLSDKERMTVSGKKIIFRGNLMNNYLKKGLIKIVKDGKIIKIRKINNFQKWRILTKEKAAQKNKIHTYYLLYYDLNNNLVEMSETYKTLIDTKKPRIINLPRLIRKKPGEGIAIDATDNTGIAFYNFDLRGKNYKKQTSNVFVLPSSLPRGISRLTVVVYDEAGNFSKKVVKIRNQ